MYGGTCPNVGCVPTKMLVHHATAQRLRGRRRRSTSPSSVAGVRALTTRLPRRQLRGARRQGHRHRHHRRRRAFVDQHTVAVGDGADQVTVTAPTILINTGSEPVIPDIPGLARQPHLRHQHRADPDHQPARTTRRDRRRLPRARVRVHLPPLRHPGHRARGRRPAPAAARTTTSPGRGGDPHRRRRPHHHRRPRHRGPRRRRVVDRRLPEGRADATPSRPAPCCPPPAAAPSPPSCGSTPPGSGRRRTGRSRSTSTCAPASRTSTPSATSTAGRSSPTSRSTTPRIVLDQLLGEGKRTTTDRVAVPQHPVHHTAAGDRRA